jgi:hypothetical protein
VPTFYPNKPVGIYLLAWILLKLLLVEYIKMAEVVASIVDKVLCADIPPIQSSTLRFCVGLSLEEGWVASVAIPGLDGAT